jgi:hypothetical protein
MIRTAFITFLLSAVPALATDVATLAAKGNQGAIDELSALPSLTDEDRLALGMFHFLRGIEHALQLRYEMNISPAYMDLPLMRLPIPPNPNAEPFRASAVQEFSAGLIAEMDAAQVALAQIPDTSAVKLQVQFADLWFDLNANGNRDAEADVAIPDFAWQMIRGGFDPVDEQGTLPVVKFDVADRSWLVAYTHFLSAFGEVILAYDPTTAIEEVIATQGTLAEINQGLEMMNAMDMQFGSFIDGFAVIQAALDQEPNREHAAAAHAHLLAMVEANRVFWKLADAETDNDAEWIPNARQVAAMGFTLPPDASATWMGVLEEGERALKGEVLLPYWRVGGGAGLNLQKMFLEPRPVDLVGWVQGRAAVPYLERGTRMSPEAWWRFERMMGGDAMLFAFLLN